MQEKTFLSQIDLEINDTEVTEAFASINFNKDFCTPVKFIFTDSFKNANKQRIPENEFDNVIRTGVNMPIKAGNVLEGLHQLEHEGASPLGVITHLTKSGSTVKGFGLLWKEERPDEVAYIKECYSKKIPINLSWELGYRNSFLSEDGTEDLQDVVVRATTFVGLPAYEGRTPVLSVASKNEESLKQMDELQKRIDELETDAIEKDKKLKEMEDEMSSLKTQNQELTEYKNSAEAKLQRETKLTEIKNRFSELGVKKEDKYFEDNAEKLLAFEHDELEFFLQELVSFGNASVNKDDKKVEVPNLISVGKEKLTPSELGKQLRELHNK